MPALRSLTQGRAAIVLSVVALVGSCTGTSYAVGKLAAGSVGSREVRDRSLAITDLSAKARTGLRGAPGAAGARGAAGAQGARGLAGKDGTTGPQGERGPAGKDGTAGQQGSPGPSGVQKLLLVDESQIVGSLSLNADTIPLKCRTAAYTPQAAGEVALVALDGSVTPGSSTPVRLDVGLAVSKDGAAFVPATTFGSEALDGGASASDHAGVSLEQGHSYSFGVDLVASGNVPSVAKSVCHETVQIIRAAS